MVCIFFKKKTYLSSRVCMRDVNITYGIASVPLCTAPANTRIKLSSRRRVHFQEKVPAEFVHISPGASLTCGGWLIHWGRVTYICVSKLTIIGSDNGLPPGRRQAIFWINAGLLLIRTLRTNFSGIFSEIHIFSFKKMHLKMSSAKWRQFCLGLNVLIYHLIWDTDE